MRYLVVILIVLAVLTPAVVVEAGREPIDIIGTWSGPLAAKIKVNRQGRDVDPFGGLTAGFGKDGSWAATDADGVSYDGTYERKGRKVIFITPVNGAGGTDSIRSAISSWILEMAADDFVEVTDLTITLTKVKMKAKARETRRSGRSIRVTNLFKFNATGTVDGEFVSTRGRLKSKGTLTPTTVK